MTKPAKITITLVFSNMATKETTVYNISRSTCGKIKQVQ
jgi:hypothetical protein